VKLRYVIACLLCLLLFVAAVDTVPDPPAVNPHNREANLVSPLHVRSFSGLQQEIVVSSSPLPYARTSSSPYGLTIETKLLGPCQLPLVRHAADTSPPIFS
jgi:hypothetical protein